MSKILADDSDEQQLTKRETPAWFRQSPRTIDYWCEPAGVKFKSGGCGHGLPYIKVGHQKRFLLGDLRRFRDAMKVNGASKKSA